MQTMDILKPLYVRLHKDFLMGALGGAIYAAYTGC